MEDVLLREEIVECRSDLVGFIDFACLQAVDQFVGREVDVHHFVGHGQHAVRHALVHLDARNLLHGLVQPLDMLDVDRRDDADPRIEQLHHVLPALGIAAAFDIGVRQFVHDHDLGMQVQDGLRVHLLEFLAFVEEPAARHEGKPCDEGFRFGTAVRFDKSDADVHACVEQLMRFLQHAVTLTHPGTHADVDFELAPVRAADQIQEPLNTAFLVHNHMRNDIPPTKLTSSAAGFQLSEVKSPSCNDPATVQPFAALTKTFCT